MPRFHLDLPESMTVEYERVEDLEIVFTRDKGMVVRIGRVPVLKVKHYYSCAVSGLENIKNRAI